MSGSHESPFRLHRPELGAGIVNRARLLSVLGERFDRRLTVVQASAGFGKTTLLAQCMVENQLDPYGSDVWLALTERDRQPDTLLAGLAEAVSAVAPVAADAVDSDDLIEALWSAAPAEIAIIVDDAHMLDGSTAWEVLARLTSSMPANVHLVLGTRTAAPLPLRALQSRARRSSSTSRRWRSIPTSFERSPMCADWSPARNRCSLPGLRSRRCRAASARKHRPISFGSLCCTPSPTLDGRPSPRWSDSVASMTSSSTPSLEVAGRRRHSSTGFLFIEAVGADRRFHDLWATALADEVEPQRWRASLEAGANVLAARGESIARGPAPASGGRDRACVGSSTDFASSSLSTGLSSPDAAWFAEALPATHRHGSLGQYLRLLALGAINNDNIRSRMRDVTELALAENDFDMAAMSIWRSIQFQADVDPTAVIVDDALENLIEQGIPFARAAAGLIMSHQAETRHDIGAALAAISMFAELEDENRLAATNSRFLALGHPERVETNLDEVLTEGAINPLTAQAVWQRGEIDPDLAWPIAAELPARYGFRQLPNVQIPLLGVVTSVALAAGQNAEARDLAEHARRQGAATAPRLRLFAGVASALVTLAEDGEEAAKSAFEALRAEAPIEPWPAWAYLSAIMPIRVLFPDTAWLDDVGFGPSLTTALEAARALLALARG